MNNDSIKSGAKEIENNGYWDVKHITHIWSASILSATADEPAGSPEIAKERAAVDKRGIRRNIVTSTVISFCVGRGRESDVKGSNVLLTFPHSLQDTTEHSWPWNRSTIQLLLRSKCCCHATWLCAWKSKMIIEVFKSDSEKEKEFEK